MATDTTTRFASALETAGVECTRTETAGFESALADAVEGTAVGAPLGIDGVSLDGTAVTTPPTPRLLQEADTGVTRVGGGVAEHGSFLIQSDAAGTEPVSLYPRKHVGVVRASDVHDTLDDALTWLGSEFRAGRDSAIVATGVSATADMGELVEGVHGPQAVHALVLTDR
ncbi:LUD domain-containing protein [Halobaculum sp. P14]|uniref:LUD domain-containing protein n=1 Tax=Halobaculum sp. P14 TaxID=3421638 RepID=UPI003EBC1130